jgi:hypothetical protein
VRALCGAALIIGALASAAEGQYAWKTGFNWPGGNGVQASVYALTVFDDGTGPALYAGGTFSLVDGITAHGVAKWNGTTWAPLADGCGSLNCGVSALAVFNDGSGPALYAGGNFTTIGGVAANYIAKWSGGTWTALGSGLDSSVSTLGVFDDGNGPALYAGGNFFMAGGMPARSIAKWNGAAWTALGTGINGFVRALTAFDDGTGSALYAGGYFTAAGDVPAASLAKWDGTNWSALSGDLGGSSPPDVDALMVFDDGTGGPALYAGGYFTMAGGVAANSIAKWDGVTWASLGSGIGGFQASYVLALTIFDDGTGSALYAGGLFTTAGGAPASYIAKWDGATWMPLGSGLNDSVYALGVFTDGTNPALYAGGQFLTAGGVPSHFIAEWAPP